MFPFFTEKTERARKQAREFGQWLKPRDSLIEDNQEIGAEVLARLWEEGFYGYLVPKELGGQGGSILELTLILEELAPISSSVSLSILIEALAILAISQDSLPERSAQRLVRVINQRRLLAFAISEPMEREFSTRAQECEDGYKIYGQKIYVNQAEEADWVIVLAETTPGASLFLVEKGSAGMMVSDNFTRSSAQGLSWAKIIFEGVKIGSEQMLGEPGRAERICESALSKSASLVSGMALGLIKAGLNKGNSTPAQAMLKNVLGLERFFAESQIGLIAGEALCYQSGFALDRAFPEAESQALASKIFTTELAYRFLSRLSELVGSQGVDYMIEWKKWLEFAGLLRSLLGSNSFLLENLYKKK